jgi:hypothetical protein
MATAKRATARKKTEPPFNPTERLNLFALYNSKGEAQAMFLIYRDESTPVPAESSGVVRPVRFRIVDKDNQFIEDDEAKTIGKAMDYALAFARGRGWVLDQDVTFTVPKPADEEFTY